MIELLSGADVTTQQVLYTLVALFAAGMLVHSLYSGVFLDRRFRIVTRAESPAAHNIHIAFQVFILCVSIGGALSP